MNILVVGRGGREHSMIKKLRENPQLEKIYVAPGNAGMEEEAVSVPIDEMNIEELAAFAKEAAIDLTVVGPESPLDAGITNRFQQENLPIFAPTKEAARLEGSKSYAKDFMKKYDIPTASYGVFQDAQEAKKRIAETGAPIVIKADGLASGKGVIVAMTEEEAVQAIDDMLVDKAFDQAGSTIVVESYLEGAEFSLMAFVHEDKVYPMIAARDHKRAFDHDEGPNTGGMGAFAPIPDLTEETYQFAVEQILQKTAIGMIKEGRPFTGILYAGLIMTKNGPKVIEFNTRFGDPETQVVLPLLKNDLVQVMQDVLAKKNPNLEWYQETCVGVVLASEGYPGTYRKGSILPKMDMTADTFIIHAGTKKTDGVLVSDGGRVLLAGGRAETLSQAADKVYQQLDNAELHGNFFYRSDIAR
ncbi:phosphoribosylamine--glycine ligase [Oceanobacillus locisalsi]|uniref:Phosphoribosylamine--glycine ligase n=1 Tax=Oceanobacillus locisalsi TaxID=546107 RepID=A0ABW3NEW8_9BACI